MQHKGYLYLHSGVYVCAAGCVHHGVPVAEYRSRDSHIILDSAAHALAIETRKKGIDTKLVHAAGIHRGRVNIDKRTLSEMCNLIKLPEPVLREANLILDFVKNDAAVSNHRGNKRQARIIAIISIACERNNIDCSGDTLKTMCSMVLGSQACAKAHAVFGRQLRAIRIALNRTLGDMCGIQDNIAMRIVNQAWSRLGRCGMGNVDVAQVTRKVQAIVHEWPGSDAEVKFGDAIVPCAVMLVFGVTHELTSKACIEYGYRMGTISKHAGHITNVLSVLAPNN